MHIAVCDDNVKFLNNFEAQLKMFDVVESINLFSNLDTFLFSVDGGRRYDAVFMDISWGENPLGIDAASELHKLSPHTKVIFVTGHVETFSQQIFLNDANLSGLLAKPVDTGILQANLQKVAQGLSFGTQPALFIKKKSLSIPAHEIIYIESQNHTVLIHTEKETVTVYETLKTVLDALPKGFFQCHKSFVVNMSQIRRFQTADILMKNGKTIPVSRKKYTATRNNYLQFMGGVPL
ncbi:MAG: LytTR family DNA-binding domain-containing protein [Defluviitaleaceae bacterium]|nr:LytTR family DNA-binding domain-containing protein [Defluviitaleaceae bacterium]